MSEDLWGDFLPSEEKNDISNLFQMQKRILSEKSSGVITGSVKRSIDTEDDLNYDFYILARALNYTKHLIKVFHPLISRYPLIVQSFTLDTHIECNNFKEFSAAVRKILSSDNVTQILKNLMSHAQ